MATSDSITTWIRTLKGGEQEAVQQLWDRYFQRLEHFISTKLPCHMKRAFDEEDVALSAFQSFVDGALAGRFPELEDRNNLWSVLAVIAARKASAYLRHANRQKRGGGEVRGESGAYPAGPDQAPGLDFLAGEGQNPELEAQFVEECERLLGSLKTEELRSIAILKMQGYAIAEIAEIVNCTQRAVQRRLEIIRRTWREELSSEESSA